MPTSAEKDQAGKAAVPRESWQGFLLSIVRIFVFQVALALALSGAFVAYLNWSSAKTFAEFLSAGAVLSPSNPALQSIKDVNPCDRGA
jgi:hypothetical protein